MHGFEKEGIRITDQGVLSRTPHPENLGSSLMHPAITTDFTEAQMELITPPARRIRDSLDHMKALHAYADAAMADTELIWPLSMPPKLPANEDDIPLAVYGNSSIAQKKTLYREGIGLRYGRKRLTISGVHYNFSLPDTKDGLPITISESYFHIIRNLYRKLPYLTYLFGASPAFDKSFDPSGIHRFKKHKRSTYYGQFATCLRLSDIGYTSQVQDRLPISYNSARAYARDLEKSGTTFNPGYEKFSFPQLRQLNANYLQTEGELYAPFRPKQETKPDEPLVDALKLRGVGRLEIRLPDIDPEIPAGVCPDTIRFLHLAVLNALINESPTLGSSEERQIKAAQEQVLFFGRKKGLRIPDKGTIIFFHETGRRYSEGLYKLAEKMDKSSDSNHYQTSVDRQIKKWNTPELTPSGRQLSHLLDTPMEFIEYGLGIARNNATHYKAQTPEPAFQAELDKLTRGSIKQQARLETKE